MLTGNEAHSRDVVATGVGTMNESDALVRVLAAYVAADGSRILFFVRSDTWAHCAD